MESLLRIPELYVNENWYPIHPPDGFSVRKPVKVRKKKNHFLEDKTKW